MSLKNHKPEKSLIKQFSSPTREEYFDFLVRCYFGEGDNLLKMAVDRAYLDLNRTLHGFAKHKNADVTRDGAHALMIKLVKKVQLVKFTQKSYDLWHFRSCKTLRNYFLENEFEKFTYGQAQKWINMTLKYIFTIGESRLEGYQDYYRFAHIPIDNVFINALQPYKKIRLPLAWSRIDNYGTYLDLQNEFRTLFPKSIPLDVEFRLWIQEKVEGGD